MVARLAPDMTVCISSDVHPEIREYERASTTVINTSLVPVVSDYLDRLEGRLAEITVPTLVVQSIPYGCLFCTDLIQNYYSNVVS